MFEDLEQATQERIEREQELEQIIIRLVKQMYWLGGWPKLQPITPELEELIIGRDQ